MQRCPLLGRQAQRQRLAMQVVLQRLVRAGQVGRFGVTVVKVIFAGWGVAAPLAVVRAGLDRAVTFPAFFEPGFSRVSNSVGRRLKGIFSLIFTASPGIYCLNSY